jgi:hypothetical protein
VCVWGGGWEGGVWWVSGGGGGAGGGGQSTDTVLQILDNARSAPYPSPRDIYEICQKQGCLQPGKAGTK